MRDRASEQTTVPPAVERGVRSLRGRGRPLPEPLRARMERAGGVRLAHVRVHDDALSHSLSAAVSARGFTVGGDIAIGRGGSDSRLLSHELAHAVQQTGTPGHGPLAPTHRGDAIERQVAT